MGFEVNQGLYFALLLFVPSWELTSFSTIEMPLFRWLERFKQEAEKGFFVCFCFCWFCFCVLCVCVFLFVLRHQLLIQHTLDIGEKGAGKNYLWNFQVESRRDFAAMSIPLTCCFILEVPEVLRKLCAWHWELPRCHQHQTNICLWSSGRTPQGGNSQAPLASMGWYQCFSAKKWGLTLQLLPLKTPWNLFLFSHHCCLDSESNLWFSIQDLNLLPQQHWKH